MTTTEAPATIPVEAIDYGARIRPLGWYGFCRAIDAEVIGDGWVKVCWEVLDHNAPGPYTMFQVGERVERA